MILSEEGKEAIHFYIFEYENTKVYEKYKKLYAACILELIEDRKQAVKNYNILGIYMALRFVKYTAWYIRANSMQGVKIHDELINVYETLNEELKSEPAYPKNVTF